MCFSGLFNCLPKGRTLDMSKFKDLQTTQIKPDSYGEICD